MKFKLKYQYYDGSDKQIDKLPDHEAILAYLKRPGGGLCGYFLEEIKEEDGKSNEIKFYQNADGSMYADCEKWTDGYPLNEFLETQLKNDSRPASTETVPPKQEEPLPSSPMLPRTLLEIRNHPLSLDIGCYERVVGQLLAAGNAKSWQCQILLRHLTSLAREFDMLRQELQKIPENELRQANELATGKK